MSSPRRIPPPPHTHTVRTAENKGHASPGALTDAQHEVVEGLVVDVCERILHGQSEVGQISQVLPALLV